jgi:hypothetical protein
MYVSGLVNRQSRVWIPAAVDVAGNSFVNRSSLASVLPEIMQMPTIWMAWSDLGAFDEGIDVNLD